MGKMSSVVHFEMPSSDQKRVSEFYSKVFGWQMNHMGEETSNYIVATTTESDEKSGRPKNSGAINGGFFPKSKENGYPSVVISVDDIKEHIKKVTEAGGKVLGEPVDIPGIGMYVSFEDTEGNRISMLQPSLDMS